MSSDLMLFVVIFGVLYLGVGAVVARKSLRWNRDQGRSRGAVAAIAVGAGLVWPLTVWFWEADIHGTEFGSGVKARLAAYGMKWGYDAQLDKLDTLLSTPQTKG